jgi:Calcineurin-like phosphoesterase
MQFNPSAPPRSRATEHKSRHVAILSNIPLLGRTTLLARFQQAASSLSPETNFPNLMAFLLAGKWLLPYLRDLIRKKNVPYPTYPKGKTGIFPLAAEHPLKIAVAADWGTGTLEADTVAKNMKADSPHYTLHLGDVYYMGEFGEIHENCLGKKRHGYAGVYWPRGTLGSFALMGNHEMYSGGHAYCKDFLAELGLFGADLRVTEPQCAAYFCLETEHWIVLGLDTGYHSGGIPPLTSVSLVNWIASLNVDARFDEKMLAWLRQTIEMLQKNGSGKKPILLLTHHQPISSFDFAFQKPAEQLAELGFLNEREFVWIYGHEHRLTIYKRQVVAKSLRTYPRCIGHGGMPVTLSKPKQVNSKVLYYDPRQHPIDVDHPEALVGYNGHALLLFEGTALKVEYHDIVGNNVLLTEAFMPNADGTLKYSCSKPPNSPLRSGDQAT